MTEFSRSNAFAEVQRALNRLEHAHDEFERQEARLTILRIIRLLTGE